MFRIVQMTDSHVTAAGTLWKDQVDNAARLATMVAAANALRPDLVVHTGDLVENGYAPNGDAEYAVAAPILAALEAPLMLCPGNHDGREAMRRAFPDAAWEGAPFLNAALDAEGLHVIGLDTVVEGRTSGALCPERLRWLAARLDDRPTLIFGHHPPCPIGLPFMDGFGFDGGDALFDALEGRDVLGIACGHVHADVARRWRGVTVRTAEPVSVQFSPETPASGEGLVGWLEPLRVRCFDWSDGALSVKTFAAERTVARVEI